MSLWDSVTSKSPGAAPVPAGGFHRSSPQLCPRRCTPGPPPESAAVVAAVLCCGLPQAARRRKCLGLVNRTRVQASAKPPVALRRPAEGLDPLRGPGTSSSSTAPPPPDPLGTVESFQAEKQLWTSSEMEVPLQLAYDAGRREVYADLATLPTEFELLCLNLYSAISIQAQAAMLQTSFLAAGLGDRAAKESASKLEEPLSWRELAAAPGIRAFAADLFLLRHIEGAGKGGKPRSLKGKGFASSNHFQEGRSTQLFSAMSTQGDKLLWVFILQVAQQLAACTGGMNAFPRPKVLLPQELNKRLEKIRTKMNSELDNLISSIDFGLYKGQVPLEEQLVSDRNSIVIVVAEPCVPADESSWSLHAQPSKSAGILENDERLHDHEDTAPVVVLTVLSHNVDLGGPGLHEAVVSVMKGLQDLGKAEGIESKRQSNEGFAGLVSGLLPALWSRGQEERNAAVRAAMEELRGQVGSHIRKIYTQSWAQLRGLRRAELDQALQQHQAKQSLLRQKSQKLQKALAGLERAVSQLDMSGFRQQSKVALQDGVSSQKISELEATLTAEIAATEQPIKELLQRCMGEEEVDLISLLPALQEALKRLELLPTSSLRRPVDALLGALSSAQALRGTLEAGARVSAIASQQLGEGSVSSASARLRAKAEAAAVQAALLEAEAAAQRAEQAARATLGAAATANSLRRWLQEVKAAVSALRNDDALRAALVSAPWNTSPIAFTSITAAHVQQLQESLSCASTEARELLLAPAESFLGLGAAALALQAAVQGVDAEALQERLNDASAAGLAGLEVATARLEALRAHLLQLEQDAEEAVEALDLETFELVAGDLPESLERALRARLLSAIAEEEAVLKAALLNPDLQQLELVSTRLPPGHKWRTAAENARAVLEAASAIREVLEGKASSSVMVQDKLRIGSTAAGKLSASIQLLGEQLPGGENVVPAMALIKDIQSAGYQGLGGLLKDEDLASVLSSPPWTQKPLHWQAVDPQHLLELEGRAADATDQGREELKEPLERALKVGRCALDISAALKSRSSTVDELERLFLEASELGLDGLEEVTKKLERLPRTRSTGFVKRQEPPKATEAPKEGLREQAVRSPEALQTQQLPDSAAETKWGSVAGLQPTWDRQSSRIIFLDLELTAGFYDFQREPKILEAAVIITDADLNVMDRGNWVLGGFSREELNQLPEFHQVNFRDPAAGGNFPPQPGFSRGNGLFEEVLSSKLSTGEVEEALLALVRRHCAEGTCPLAGYSVQCDREVLKVQMPRFYRYLSHQIIDVSSFLQVARLWQPEKLQTWERRPSGYNHRAVNDLEDSLATLRWVRENVFK